MIIESVRHRGLRRFIEQNNPRFLRRNLAGRIEDVVLTLLDSEDLSRFIALAPGGWRVHRLYRNRGDEWSVSVSGNWRITFQEENGVIYNLNLEDYH